MKTIKLNLLAITIMLSSFSVSIDAFGQFIKAYEPGCSGYYTNASSMVLRIDATKGFGICGTGYLSCGIGYSDWVVTKTNLTGLPLVNKVAGFGYDDQCNSIIQTAYQTDTSYILAGNMTSMLDAQMKATFLKLNKNLALPVSKRLADSNESSYSQVITDNDKNWVFSGYAQVRYELQYLLDKTLITKYNPVGGLLWGRKYIPVGSGGEYLGSNEEAVSVCFQRRDNSYGVAVKTNVYFEDSFDIMIVKLNNNGDMLWNRVYRNYDSAVTNTEPYKIIAMNDGGFVVVGKSNFAGSPLCDILIFRVAADGTLLWSYTYGEGPYNEIGTSILQDGQQLVVTGKQYFHTMEDMHDAILMKVDAATGALLFAKMYTPDDLPDRGNDIIKLGKGSVTAYAIAGSTMITPDNERMTIIRTDNMGNIGSSGCGEDLSFGYEKSYPVLDSLTFISIPVSDKTWTPNLDTVGTTASNLCEISSDNFNSIETDGSGNNPLSYSLDQNYPNPFNPVTTIKYQIAQASMVRLSVFDIAGREVGVLVNESLNAGSYRATFDGSALSSGVYFIKLQAGSYSQIRKMTLVK